MRNSHKILVEDSQLKRPILRSKSRGEDNIKIDLRFCDAADWLQMDENSFYCRFLRIRRWIGVHKSMGIHVLPEVR